MIYFAVFSGLVLLRYVATDLCLRRLLYFPFLILLFIFSAFRFEVGCDWTGYLNQYYVYGPVSIAELFDHREALWVGLFALQNWFDLPYPWINVFSSLIFFLGLHVMARRQADPFAFLVILFPVLIINMPMSGIRQGAAIGVMFLAFVAFSDRRLFRFIFLTIAASAVHSSALFFLLLSPLVRRGYSYKRLILAGLLAIPGGFLLMTGDAAEVATSRYVDSGREAAGAVFRVGLLALSAIYFFLFLRRKWSALYPEDFKLVMVGALLMITMTAILPLSTIIADRLAYYLIPIQAMIFARIPYLPWRNNKAFHTALPYLALLLVFATWTSLSWHFNLCYIPYQTWLFGYPGSMRY